MTEILETYNLINYLKIIDLSLLNLLDYSDFQNESLIIEHNNKLVLNFNGKTKKILESLMIRNINDSIFYNMKNIVVNTCSPKENWHNIDQIVSRVGQKYCISDESIYIDNIKMNVFFDKFFKKLENINNFNLTSNSKNILIQNSTKFIEFKCIDIYDSFTLIGNILSNFGNLRKDDFRYNIISDGNRVFMHGGSIVNELQDEVRLMLINKGVI